VNHAARALRVVIPAYNEASRIAQTIDGFCREFEHDGTVLIVANGCTDATVDLLRSKMAVFGNLHVLEISARIGKGGAVRAGLVTGDEPYVGFVDADNSTDAAEYRRLFEHLRMSGLDGVIASRWLPGARLEPCQPLARRLVSRVFNALARVMLGLRFCDTQCGAKLFKRGAIRSVFDELQISDFGFDIDLLLQLQRRAFSIGEVPTTWSDKAQGSKVNLLRTAFRMALALVHLRLADSIVGRLPFFEFVAGRSIMPVDPSASILVLGDAAGNELATRTLERCGLNLLRDGHRIDWLGSSDASVAAKLYTRLRILSWYVTRSHRRYTAVVEIASDVPFIIPAFSAKRTFLVGSARRAVARWIYQAAYARSHRVEALALDDVGLAALARTMSHSGLAPIRLERSGKLWSLCALDEQAVSQTFDLI
jgi:hypothetical protein